MKTLWLQLLILITTLFYEKSWFQQSFMTIVGSGLDHKIHIKYFKMKADFLSDIFLGYLFEQTH